MEKITLIHLKKCPIFKQLQLEEALLRATNQNFCLINEGSSQEAIVMGISSKVEEHLHKNRVIEEDVDVIRRFSGGGTVFVDKDTYFVSFIINKESLDISPFPEPILRWSESFYKGVFNKYFSLKENDYTFRDRKFGGNAKYIQKDRWLLHTSFLWDYDEERMSLLRNPKVAPRYRERRSHSDFLTTLNDYFESMEEISNKIEEELKQHFKVIETLYEYPEHYLYLEHRKGTKLISLS